MASIKLTPQEVLNEMNFDAKAAAAGEALTGASGEPEELEHHDEPADPSQWHRREMHIVCDCTHGSSHCGKDTIKGRMQCEQCRSGVCSWVGKPNTNLSVPARARTQRQQVLQSSASERSNACAQLMSGAVCTKQRMAAAIAMRATHTHRMAKDWKSANASAPSAATGITEANEARVEVRVLQPRRREVCEASNWERFLRTL